MPVWHHVPCFTEWQQHGKVCSSWRLQGATAGLLGRENSLVVWADDAIDGGKTSDNDAAMIQRDSKSTWDELVSQLIWRGSDFGFLHCIYRGRKNGLLLGSFDDHVKPRLSLLGENARGVALALMENLENLTPRWKGVAFTAMAELDVMESSNAEKGGFRDEKPWIDSKFTIRTSKFGKSLDKTKETERYAPFQEYGVEPIGDHMTLEELSHYKYHIDLGGGGETFSKLF